MRIVFHGDVAAAYREGFAPLLADEHEITDLPERMETEAQRRAYAGADVIIANRLDASLPLSLGLRLFHTPTTGIDKIDMSRIPASALLCNCFGHEIAIAEYVMAVLLLRHIPIAKADAALRRGEWPYYGGAPVRGEAYGETIGILGFGRIGQAIAARAKPFGMRVHVANRSRPAPAPVVDRLYGLDELPAFLASAEAVVCALPLVAATEGLIGRKEIATLRPNAYLVNVGRGKVIDAAALYDALRERRIAGAAIDTWYNYPATHDGTAAPSALPFDQLANIVMTPHMSGWTTATRRRRQETMAANIDRLMRGQPLTNIVERAGPRAPASG